MLTGTGDCASSCICTDVIATVTSRLGGVDDVPPELEPLPLEPLDELGGTRPEPDDDAAPELPPELPEEDDVAPLPEPAPDELPPLDPEAPPDPLLDEVA